MPNPWDVGSARLLASLGFQALATTSSGFAATLGRVDGGVTRDEAISHAASVAAAVDVPVSADLENCFADSADGVAETVRLAVGGGLAGCSVEDFTSRRDDPIYDAGLARERVVAAAEAAHSGPGGFALTARCEMYLHGQRNLSGVIERLQSYQEAGADVLFAPGVIAPDELKQLLASVDRPVNVLPMPGCPPVAELAALGVARISVGGAFAFSAYGAAVAAGRELLDHGTYGYWDGLAASRDVVRAAFTPS